MAIVKVKKITFIVHKSEKDELVDTLQEAGIVHISDIKEDPDFKNLPEVKEKKVESTNPEIEYTLSRIRRVIEFFNQFDTKKGFLETFFEIKPEITEDDLKTVSQRYDYKRTLSRVEEIEKRLTEIKNLEVNLQSKIDSLRKWYDLDLPLEEIGESEKVEIIAGTVPINNEEELKKIEGIETSVVSRDSRFTYTLIVFLKEDAARIKNELLKIGFEQVDFRGMKGRPRELIEKYKKEIEKLEEERIKQTEEARKLAQEKLNLLIVYDYLSNINSKYRVSGQGIETKATFLVLGWIKEKDLKKVDKIVKKFDSATYIVADPGPEDNPPTFIDNKKSIKPFELLTKLYGLPNLREVDPTPLLTPFFAVFFGLCLTDAGYGISLIILSLLLMKKLGKMQFLVVLLYGGITSIFAGAMTGSWFGDLFTSLPIPFLHQFRNSLLLFDPMVNPMPFFYLSLAFGLLQVELGLLVGFYKRVKNGEFLDGLANELSWFFMLLFVILAYLISSKSGKSFGDVLFHSGFIGYLMAFFIFAPIALIIFLSGGTSGSFIVRVVKGLYNLYGVTGYVGDLLSYVRLMALGMVTAGIAMSINIVAKLVLPVPYIGIILAILIFIGGHLFSIIINVMGAFVHSLRLQYVEFFTKFYDNGGYEFKPFSIEGYYTEIKK